jgi:hypothetical protein
MTTAPWQHGRIRISENGRFLQHEDGTPFFWLADTAWQLATRLTLAETEEYFADRSSKGFTVAQVVAAHSAEEPNRDGRLPFLDGDPSRPDTRAADAAAGLSGPSFWEHLDAVIDIAAEAGVYVALLPVWGTSVKKSEHPAAAYGTYAGWLARRYRDRPNIFWVNGGDVRGTDRMDVWKAIGGALHAEDGDHLATYHPFGRTHSATWFHDEEWLDFNMVQSGHRTYDQVWDDNPATWVGPDSWRYIEEDYRRWPVKPVIDGEPCYEDIPRGLHDARYGYWGREDARRYAYWAVFAGAAGHTYGQNAVIQLYQPRYRPAFATTKDWREGIAAPGSADLQHLKALVLAYPYTERIPDQTVIVGDPGFREDRLLVTRGESYLFAYRFTGRPFELRGGVLAGDRLRVRWMDPATGELTAATTIANEATLSFVPPVGAQGNTDMVLVLDTQIG